MKLTEAQLKAIIAEEVQAAIEEGLFGNIGGALRAGAGALKGAVAGVGSAIKQGAADVKKAADAGAAQAGLASAKNDARAMNQKLVPVFQKLANDSEGMSIALGVIENLARAAGIDLEDYKEMKARQKAPEQSLKDYGDQISPTAGGIGGRGSVATVSGTIAESIVRRITQESKRRR